MSQVEIEEAGEQVEDEEVEDSGSVEAMEEEVEEEDEEDAQSANDEEIADEEDKEEIAEDEAQGEGKKRSRKKRDGPVRHRPPTDRYGKIMSYDTHLRHSRKKRPEVEDGEEPKKRIKLKSRTKAKRATEYYQNRATSGTMLNYAKIKRAVGQQAQKALEEMTQEGLQWQELNEATQKRLGVPFLKVPEKVRLSQEAVHKIIGATQGFLDDTAEWANVLHNHRKSVTVTQDDVTLAQKIVAN